MPIFCFDVNFAFLEKLVPITRRISSSNEPIPKEIALKCVEGVPRMGPSGNVPVTFSVLCQVRLVLSSTDSGGEFKNRARNLTLGVLSRARLAI
jgi:hypothetical protein